MNSRITFALLVLVLPYANAQLDNGIKGLYEIKINNEWTTPETGTAPSYENQNKNIDEISMRNIKYPSLAMRMGVEAGQILEIVIDSAGKVSSIQLINHIGADVGKEIEKLSDILPRTWIPATLNGHNIESKVLILYHFTLTNLTNIQTPYNIYRGYKVWGAAYNLTVTTGADPFIEIIPPKEKKKARKKRNKN